MKRQSSWFLKPMTAVWMAALASQFCFASPVQAINATVYTVSGQSDTDCSDNDCTLQAALDAAAANGSTVNEIRIAQGTYTGNFHYLPTADNSSTLRITGGWTTGFTSRSTDPATTVLDGNGGGHVLAYNTFPPQNKLSGYIEIEGITIRNGKSHYGGGIFIITEPPGMIAIRSTIIENNEAAATGGGCALLAGTIDANGNITGPAGGGIVLEDTVLRNNAATGYTDNGSPSSGDGGGCAILVTSDARLVNTLIHDNSAGTSGSYDGLGGGLSVMLFNGTTHLVNTTITGNHAYTENGTGSTGGGVFLDTDNNAWGATGVEITNSIIYGNGAEPPAAADDIANHITTVNTNTGHLIITYSDYGELAGPGVQPFLNRNLNRDPLFSSNPSTRYYLTSKSPCVDAGDNTATFTPNRDLAGNPRPQDGNNDGTPVTNMGCYEQVVQTFPWAMFIPAVRNGTSR